MRKYALLFMAIFCTGLLFSGGFSISADMNLSTSTLTLDSPLAVYYSFELDSSSLVNFVIKMGDVVILNETITTLSLSNVVEWNIGTTPAGDYTISLTVDPEGDTIVVTSEDLTIVESARIDAPTSDDIFTFEDSIHKEYLVRNTGNIPLHVSIDTEGTYFYSVSPMNFNLGVDENQTVSVTITKPSQDTEMSITYSGVNGTHEVDLTTAIRVMLPVVNISINNITFEVVGNETQFSIEVNNDGNMPQNLTFTITTISGVFSHSEVLGAPSRTTFDFSIPSTDRVTKVEMSYTDSDGTAKIIEQRYDIIQGLGPLFDVLFGIWNSELLRGVVITIIVLVILILLWKIIRRGR